MNEYHHECKQSVVGKIFSPRGNWQERVDRVVICGNAFAIAAARALFAAGCHPYHNEQSRGERAGYPRVYFAGDSRITMPRKACCICWGTAGLPLS